MLLNLLRVEEADPEYMMQRSFYQFQQNRSVPKLEKGKKVLLANAFCSDRSTPPTYACAAVCMTELKQTEEKIKSIVLVDPKGVRQMQQIHVG